MLLCSSLEILWSISLLTHFLHPVQYTSPSLLSHESLKGCQRDCVIFVVEKEEKKEKELEEEISFLSGNSGGAAAALSEAGCRPSDPSHQHHRHRTTIISSHITTTSRPKPLHQSIVIVLWLILKPHQNQSTWTYTIAIALKRSEQFSSCSIAD